MGILSWIVVGLIAGWLAEQFVRRPKYGIVGTIIVGVIGGMLGGYLASTFLKLHDPVNGINLPSIITAFLGSLALLMLIRVVSGRRI